MLVVCPKCFTQYVVPDEHRLPEGQKFHCSACHHYFYLNSGEQTGFYDNENGESDVIPTVTAVMTKTAEPSALQQPQITASKQKSYQAEKEVLIENHLNIKPSDMYAEPTTTIQQQLNEPMSLLANESPQAYDRLDSLPEEFKPITQEKKKTSSFSLIFWLCVAGGICYFAYAQKDFLIQQIDNHIIGALDKKHNITQPKESKTKQKVNTIINQQKTQEIKNNQDKTISDTPQTVQEVKVEQTKKINSEVKKEITTQIKNKSIEQKNESQVNEKIKEVQQQPAVQPILKEETAQNTVTLKEEVEKKSLQPIEKHQEKIQPIPTQNNESLSVDIENETQPVIVKETEKKPETIINTDTFQNQTEQMPEINTPELQPIPTIPSDIGEQEKLNQPNEKIQEITETKTETILTENTIRQEIIPNQQADISDVNTQNQTEIITNDKKEDSTAEQILHQSENILLSGESSQPIIVRETVKLSDSYADLEPVKNIPTNDTNRILKIQDVSYEISENEVGMMRLMIKGIVANTELEKVTIPELKAVVYNAEDMVIARKRIILSQPEIEGNSTQEFFSSVVPAPEGVSHVEVLFDE